ncbi:MAG: thiamine pyrophosphate-binding protein [Terriglobales bacterium]
MRVADYAMQFVASLGVRHVFLVVGGGAMHLNDALARCPGLEYVCVHHEQAAAIAAEAYAKATDNLGVAMVTTGPGGTNAITGLAGAWLDSTPCLFLSGQVKRADRMYKADGTPLGVRQRGIQEVDIVTIVRPLTKYAVTVTDPGSIRYHLGKAVHLARTGRPGPVWIDIPIDVQAAPIDPEKLEEFTAGDATSQETGGLGDSRTLRSIGHQVAEPPSPQVGLSSAAFAVKSLIERLNSAERPLLLIGNGVRLAGAVGELHEVLRLLNIPVASTWLAMDLVGDEEPLFVGRPGTVAPRAPNFALQNCDFLLAVGARLDLPVVGWSASQFARGAYKAMVDVDPAELAKLEGVMDVGICSDAGDFLRELLRQREAVQARDRKCWLQLCEEWKQRYPLVQPGHRGPEGRVSIYNLAEVIGAEVSPDDQIVSGSSGSAIEIFLLAYRARAGQRVFHTAALGAMGFGLPASIGVCLASGRQRTVCVDGDGGFQFNIQELATVARLGLPIKFFILNNRGYASIRASPGSL